MSGDAWAVHLRCPAVARVNDDGSWARAITQLDLAERQRWATTATDPFALWILSHDPDPDVRATLVANPALDDRTRIRLDGHVH